MATEERSLWELYDSETEPWRRGRLILILIAAFHLVVQIILIGTSAVAGNLERAVIFAAESVLFWLLFYFIWIGIHWIRFVWGGWNMVAGFCLLIWAWLDLSGIETVAAVTTFLTGFYLCFSPSVYFFARRQHETIRWRESILTGLACVLVLGSVGAAAIGLAVMREQWRRDASAFAAETGHRIYQDRDFQWVLAHVTAESLMAGGPDRLRLFFQNNKKQLGDFGLLEEPRTQIRLRFQPPFGFAAEGHADARAETAHGPVEVHETFQSKAGEWQIIHMWWSYLPLPETAPQP
jgi:hypothetical protein